MLIIKFGSSAQQRFNLKNSLSFKNLIKTLDNLIIKMCNNIPPYQPQLLLQEPDDIPTKPFLPSTPISPTSPIVFFLRKKNNVINISIIIFVNTNNQNQILPLLHRKFGELLNIGIILLIKISTK